MLAEQIFPARQRLDVLSVFLECGLRLQSVPIGKVVVECLARNAAADFGFAVPAPEYDAVVGVALVYVGKGQRAFVGHAEHTGDCENGRNLKVLLRILEAGNRRRAHLCQQGQLLLGQVHSSSSADRFFDKNWPIELKLPFHRRSMRSSRFCPRGSSPTRFAASVTAFSAALRRWSSFRIASVSTALSRPKAILNATRCLGRRLSSARLAALPIARASWR